MKTIFQAVVVFAWAASAACGQQTPPSPSPANISTAPPQRYSAEEMSRFRSMRKASSMGAALSLGDQSRTAQAAPPSAVRVASYQTNPGEPQQSAASATGGAAAPTAPASPTDDVPVPNILSGKPSTTPTAPPRSPSVPDEFSLNQQKSASPSGAFKPNINPTASRPEMRTFGGLPGQAPAMAAPPEPKKIDLRTPAGTFQPTRPPAATDASVTPTGAQEDSSAPRQERIASAIPELGSIRPESLEDKDAASGEKLPLLRAPDAATPATKSTSLPVTRGLIGNQRDFAGGTGEQATIHSAGAAIAVSTAGPRSISIGKNAHFEVLVANSGATAADQLQIAFTVPSWIEISNATLTQGEKELVKEDDATRVFWRIDRLEAGKTQKLVLNVIPHKAQVFDLNVEWSVAPLAGAVQVQVTEPLLKMAISGPDEVQFGQSALYNVTVRNPGTGVAENVVVMLSEALGGERATLGNLGPGQEQNIQVELIARSAGQLDLSAGVSGDGDLQDSATKQITVRRAQLEIAIQGPGKKYAGAVGNYQVTVENTGDAVAQEVFAALGFPAGAKYLNGIDGAEKIEGGIRWSVGALPPGAQRSYTVACQLNAPGSIQLETGVRGAGDLADAASIETFVETEADLVLTVDDPQGPLPVGQDVAYRITVKNRGTKAATGVDVVMHFSNGIDPISAEGRAHEIKPGEVSFASIERLGPNEELVLEVKARATMAGTHEFRAQLTCDEADAREVAGGTTKFFGDEDVTPGGE